MILIPVPILTLPRDLQPAKELLPKKVTEFGNTISVKFLQLLNASLPILVTLLGIVILVKL